MGHHGGPDVGLEGFENMGLGLAGAIVGGLLCFRRRDRRLLFFRPHDTARVPGDFGVKVEQFPALVLRLLAELSPLISFKAPGRARLSLGDEYGEYRDYGLWATWSNSPSLRNRMR